jgi:hypothetical protein
MDSEEQKSKDYLEELYRQTGGDIEVQVSMYDVGAAIGLDKNEAGSVAEQLMVQGQTELRTLAGGISITPDGLTVLGISTSSQNRAENSFHLGEGPVADETDRHTVHLLTEEIKNEISGLGLDYALLEEIVLDLKTIEVHMLSPRPKVPVLLEIFRSLQPALKMATADKSAGQLATILS